MSADLLYPVWSRSDSNHVMVKKQDKMSLVINDFMDTETELVQQFCLFVVVFFAYCDFLESDDSFNSCKFFRVFISYYRVRESDEGIHIV